MMYSNFYHRLDGSPNLLYKSMRFSQATPGNKTPEQIATKLGVTVTTSGILTVPTLTYGSDRDAKESIHQTFSRKEVPFGGLHDEFSHLSPFLPQNLHHGIRRLRTAITRASLKIDAIKTFAPRAGFSVSGNLTASSKFASVRPLLPWQPSGGFYHAMQ